MKRRIIERTDSNGVTKYEVQYKFIFWFYECTLYDLESAKKYVSYNPAVETKIHNIE